MKEDCVSANIHQYLDDQMEPSPVHNNTQEFPGGHSFPSPMKFPSTSTFQQNEVKESAKKESVNSEIVHLDEENPSSNNNEPLLFIDVNITPTQTERLEVFQGDTPEQLAYDFCEKHNLPEKMYQKLVKLLGIQMEDIESLAQN